jgi:hypothetical protein
MRLNDLFDEYSLVQKYRFFMVYKNIIEEIFSQSTMSMPKSMPQRLLNLPLPFVIFMRQAKVNLQHKNME